MADKLEGMPSSEVLVDPETGRITQEWRDWLEELVFGKSDRSVGTILSGLNSTTAKTDAIVAGTQELTNVVIKDRGSLVTEQDAQNTTATADFSATPDKVALFGSGSSGTLESDAATITVSGGTAPYTLSASLVSGDTFTAVFSPTSLASDGSFTVKFQKAWVANAFFAGVQKVTVTDSAGSPLTAEVNLSVSLWDVGGIGAA